MRYREPKLRKRGKRWQIDYVNPDGIRRQLSAGYSREGAERLRIKFASWLIDGKDPEIERIKERDSHRHQAVTIRELFPLFMDRHGCNRSKKMQVSYKNSFDNVCRCPQLADAPLVQIDQGLVQDYIECKSAAGWCEACIGKQRESFSIGVTEKSCFVGISRIQSYGGDGEFQRATQT